MSKHEDKQSIDHEPHLRPGAGQADPSEKKADHDLRAEASRPDSTYRSRQSVFDEPDILPGREGEVVEQDWSCSRCGYNLRGLPLEKGCPECGHRELYRPPPRGTESYYSWLQVMRAHTSARTGWYIALLAALVGGPLAVIAALTRTGPGGFMWRNLPLLAVVFGPVVEETMKIAAASYVVDVRPYLFSRIEQIQVAAAGSSFLFAVIENLIYLHVYIANPSTTIIVWRWTACVALHVGCTLLASRGVIEVWRRTMTERRQPRISQALPTLIAAILLHACFNAGVMGYEWLNGPL